MAMTPATCVTALATAIRLVSGIGVVHEQRKIMRNDSQMKAVLWDQSLGKMCGWMISWAPNGTAVSERNPGYKGIGVKGGGNVITTMQFQIEGWHVLDEANQSEIVFRDLVWAVADELNAYGVLAIANCHDQTPANVEQFGFSMVANAALLHYAKISIGFSGRTRP